MEKSWRKQNNEVTISFLVRSSSNELIYNALSDFHQGLLEVLYLLSRGWGWYFLTSLNQ